MNKLKVVLLVVVLTLLLTLTTAQIEMNNELEFITEYTNTTDQIEKDWIVPVEYEYVCETDWVTSVTSKKNIGSCYEKDDVWNDTAQSFYKEVIYEQIYDSIDTKDRKIYWTEKEKLGTYVDYVNTTVAETIGLSKGKTSLYFEDCNIVCKAKGDIISCDSTKDGNGDGILQSGESGFTFNNNDLNWYKLNIKSDSEWYNKLRGCKVR